MQWTTEKVKHYIGELYFEQQSSASFNIYVAGKYHICFFIFVDLNWSFTLYEGEVLKI